MAGIAALACLSLPGGRDAVAAPVPGKAVAAAD
jgi:hypothetical protein